MKFGRVEGLCVPLGGSSDEPVVRVTVYLETDIGIDIVREIEVVPEQHESGVDLYWEADQWTQETIATILIPRGWELLGATDPPTRDPGEIPRSPRYALRTSFWVPPPGWDEDAG
jgi:hypothetical protein